jgi:hypothetical protein
MDEAEPRQLLAQELESLRRMSHADLLAMLPVVTREWRVPGFSVELEKGGLTPRHRPIVRRGPDPTARGGFVLLDRAARSRTKRSQRGRTHGAVDLG